MDENTLLKNSTEALRDRDVRSGFALMENWLGDVTTDSGSTPFISISVLLSIAQWVDLGFRDVAFLERLTAPRASESRVNLTAVDFLKLRLVQAFLDLARERTEQAVESIDLILRIREDLLDRNLIFLCHFWKGRAHRKQGEYESAAVHILAARASAEADGAPKLAAVVKIHQSWLAFQSDERGSAFQLLDEAETTLQPTTHALSLGNIESARGRFVRRSGDYEQALAHFEKAIFIYLRGCPNHPNLARALVNAAYVKRLIALDLQDVTSRSSGKGKSNAKALRTAQEGLELLRRALEIYASHEHLGGKGSVLVNSAQLHLDIGDIEKAALEGDQAYQLGEWRHDQILMARARNVQSAVALARAEEQIGDRPNTAYHAHSAVQYAESAVELALHTQNRRLLCEAYIARSMAAASEYLRDFETAGRFTRKAAEVLNHDDRDHLYKQMAALKSRLANTTRMDDRLLRWCEGIVQEETFQQIQEQFAEIVIPKVWLRNCRNVSLVAKTLSISPKKVRRILRAARDQDSS